ncbi:MAG: CapA family protein [Ardenticatenaceae bacterium]|nr:CapA family protein [Ardenticatenaceae bacterium]
MTSRSRTTFPEGVALRLAVLTCFSMLLAACSVPAAPQSVDVPATVAPVTVERAAPSAAALRPPTATLAATFTPQGLPAVATPRLEAPAAPSLRLASATATPEAARQVQLMAVGDVMLARSIGARIQRQGPEVPFAAVAPTLNQADLTVANLECSISDRGQPQPKAYTFRAPPAAAESLALAGIDVVSLANNHAMDYGSEALADTLQLLDQRGVAAVGAGANAAAAHAPVVVERHGLKIAFLAFVDVPVEGGGFDTRRWVATATEPGVAWADVASIAADVAAARAEADVVVVLLHFGFEGRSEPGPAQRDQAHAAIDAGASLVLGAHPHVLQPVEAYHGGVIVYSLGNFVFDGFQGVANTSTIFVATLTREGVQDFSFIPVKVNTGLPHLADPSS